MRGRKPRRGARHIAAVIFHLAAPSQPFSPTDDHADHHLTTSPPDSPSSSCIMAAGGRKRCAAAAAGPAPAARVARVARFPGSRAVLVSTNADAATGNARAAAGSAGAGASSSAVAPGSARAAANAPVARPAVPATPGASAVGEVPLFDQEAEDVMEARGTPSGHGPVEGAQANARGASGALVGSPVSGTGQAAWGCWAMRSRAVRWNFYGGAQCRGWDRLAWTQRQRQAQYWDRLVVHFVGWRALPARRWRALGQADGLPLPPRSCAGAAASQGKRAS